MKALPGGVESRPAPQPRRPRSAARRRPPEAAPVGLPTPEDERRAALVRLSRFLLDVQICGGLVAAGSVVTGFAAGALINLMSGYLAWAVVCATCAGLTTLLTAGLAHREVQVALRGWR